MGVIFFQILPDVILQMNEKELIDLFPVYGDRTSIRQFCQSVLSTSRNTRKEEILARLRKKLSICQDKELDSSDLLVKQRRTEIHTDNKNALKMTRQISIGWLNQNQKFRYVQVKKVNGGGKRKLTVSKQSSSRDIVELGKNVFFPGGFSRKNELDANNFDCLLLDFERKVIDPEKSVEEMYQLTGQKILRLYIATKLSIEPARNEVTASGSGVQTSSNEVATSESGVQTSSNEVATSGSGVQTSSNEVATPGSGVQTSSNEVATSGSGVQTSSNEVATSGSGVQTSSNEVVTPGSGVQTFSIRNEESTLTLLPTFASSAISESVPVEMSLQHLNDYDGYVRFYETSGSNQQNILQYFDTYETGAYEDAHTFGMNEDGMNEDGMNENGMDAPALKSTRVVSVHRGLILKELIEQFKSIEIQETSLVFEVWLNLNYTTNL